MIVSRVCPISTWKENQHVRNRKGTRRQDKAPDSTTETLGASAATPAGVDSIRLGVPNITRRFRLDTTSDQPSVYSTPPFFLQGTLGLNAFLQGYSKSLSNTLSTSELGDVLDITADPKSVLYPRTPYAEYWLEQVWPIMLNLFESGVGSRYAPTSFEVIRYFGNVMLAYQCCFQAVVLNYMAYRFDWTKSFPHTESIPPSLFNAARDYKADDVGMAETWLPLMQRVELYSMPPSLIREAQRLLSPWLTLGIGQKVVIPYNSYLGNYPWTWIQVGDTPPDNFWDAATRAKDALEYVDNMLYDTSNLIRSFIPFPVSLNGPWDPTQWPLEDAWRAGASGNQSHRFTSAFGKGSTSGWPSDDEGLAWTFEEGRWGPLSYYSPLPFTSWGELQFSCGFSVDTTPTIGRDFALVTPHNYNGYGLLADNYSARDNKTYLATDVSDDVLDDAARYYKTFPGQRWMFADENDVDFGFLLPETIVTEVPYEAVLRILRLRVEADWEYNALRQITMVSMGSSLREIRTLFQNIVAGSLRQQV